MTESIDVFCAGIVVADHVCTPIDHLPAAGELVMAERMLLTLGGCAANTAVDLAKMEVRSAVVGRIGDDLFGRVVTDMLRDARVDATHLLGTPGTDTSQTLIVNVTGQDRRFIHTFGANAQMRASDLPLSEIVRAKVLYVGGYLIMPELKADPLAEVFATARAAGVRTVLDVVTPPGTDHLSRLAPLLPHTDVFLPNTDEARLITGESDPIRQAEAFRQLGAGTVVITLGGDGSVLVNERERIRAGVFNVPFVDASGGGDAFDAGYIYGLLHQLDTVECLRVASALGASCVRAIGTTPGVFTRAECEEFLKSHALTIRRV
jgi:sugar/nucleoside kinase (ribokinase family)